MTFENRDWPTQVRGRVWLELLEGGNKPRGTALRMAQLPNKPTTRE
jgi:hypothetical protein